VSLALELRARGMNVLALDQSEPGTEASSAAAGMLAPGDPGTPELMRQLAEASAHMFPEFVAGIESASGMSTDFCRDGAVDLLERGAVPGRDYKPLPAAEVASLEPELRAGDLAGFFVQEDWVDPPLLMQAALVAAARAGVAIRGNCRVTEMRSLGSGVEVRAAGENFKAEMAVNCCGAWSGAPVKPRKGQMLYVEPRHRGLLKHVIRSPQVYIMPRRSGRILIGATVEDAGFSKDVEADVIRELQSRAAEIVPALEGLTVAQSWAGLRPGTPDDLPILGRKERGVYVASGHFRNGILLAPATAQVMADLMTGRTPAIDLRAFAPDRFQSGA